MRCRAHAAADSSPASTDSCPSWPRPHRAAPPRDFVQLVEGVLQGHHRAPASSAISPGHRSTGTSSKKAATDGHLPANAPVSFSTKAHPARRRDAIEPSWSVWVAPAPARPSALFGRRHPAASRPYVPDQATSTAFTAPAAMPGLATTAATSPSVVLHAFRPASRTSTRW